MKRARHWMTAGLLLAAASVLAASPAVAGEFRSYANVQDDGTLVIQNKLVRLHGIYIPQQGQFCDTQFRPARCGSRAAVALEFKIQGFVTCREMGYFNDGSISAICWNRRGNFDEGDDLGAYLITQGLALAGPNAPYEYRALERVAEANGVGIWGFQADSYAFPRRR